MVEQPFIIKLQFILELIIYIKGVFEEKGIGEIGKIRKTRWAISI